MPTVSKKKKEDIRTRLRKNRQREKTKFWYVWKKDTFLIQIYGAPTMVMGNVVKVDKEDKRPVFGIDVRGPNQFHVTHIATMRALGEFIFTSLEMAKKFCETMVATEGIDWTIDYTKLVDEKDLKVIDKDTRETEDRANAGFKQWILSMDNKVISNGTDDDKLNTFLRYIHKVVESLFSESVTDE